MTITEERPQITQRDRSRDGGVPARRAIIRWAWRMVRREWRGQLVVVLLLTLSVAASIGLAAAVYNLTSADGDAQFGGADHAIAYDDPDPQALAATIAAARDHFGDVDLIERRSVAVPGVFEPLELRAQDPNGSYAAPMLGLVSGRYPSAADEVAMTDGAAKLLNVSVGDTFTLDGQSWTDVGIVENPADLTQDFALVTFSGIGTPTEAELLVTSSESNFEDFRPGNDAPSRRSGRSTDDGVLAATGILVMSTVVLMLVALIAAVGFVVVARRRLRQLGMLAAMGATERHLRLVMLANGAFIGVLAAVAGALLGLAGWVAATPALENAVGHRIARFNVPWWVIGTSMLLAVLSATGAAWWPARSIARTSILSALSGRPDKPRSGRRSTALSAAFFVAGTGCLVIGNGPVRNWADVTMVLGGTGGLILGVLGFSPLAIRTLAARRARAPISVRLALGDLARYQARSGTALAAIGLALGLASTVVLVTSGEMYGAASEGNLSDHQVLLGIAHARAPGGDAAGPAGPEQTPTAAQIPGLVAAADAIAAAMNASAIPLDAAILPVDQRSGGPASIQIGAVIKETGGSTEYSSLSPVYVASPALLALYGLDEDAVDPDADALTTYTGKLFFLPVRDAPVNNPQHLDATYTSLPQTFITAQELADRGWQSTPSGWLLQTPNVPTSAQLADARAAAAAAGLTVEVRDGQSGLATTRNVATAGGGVLALAIMAMTIGLIRSESSGDLRILSAAGATSGNRRTITAATAASLALLGAVLGLVGAYVGLAAAHAHELDALTPVPYLHLAIIVVGLPLVAAAAGWVFAGREPSWLARQPMD